MKRILFLFLVMAGFTAQSQVYNNEWINYNLTYYKFKVGVTGLYRINQPTLASLGIGSAPAEQFQLWRNGQEVPLFTTVSTGAMGASDFIEFWGEMNDGKPDNALFRDPDFQLNDKWSLETDTAIYWLSVNPVGAHLRYQTTANNVIGTPLPIEKYFMHSFGNHWRIKINQGYAAVVGSLVYSSAYDQGEGWTSGDLGANISFTDNLTNLAVYSGPGAPDGSLKINGFGNALNQRTFQVSVNGNMVINEALDFYDYKKYNVPVPIATISSGSAAIEFKNLTSAGTDRLVFAQDILTYPRVFDFANARNFEFELPANPNGNYLEISNFNHNSTPPVLYDITNGRRYVADISNPALVKIVLLPSATLRKMVLVSEDVVNVNIVSSITVKNFVNFSLPSNQGNYLIITHPVLTTSTGGGNPVDDFKAYRASAVGGSFNTKVYFVDELIDQFAFGIKRNPLGIRNFLRWAKNNFATTPIRNVFLIGKGVFYFSNRLSESNPNLDKLSLVPTWGMPGSDNLLACEPNSEIPMMPIGRLSVINGDEITVYLNKVKEYEQVQATPSPFIIDKAWMKNVGHVIGASDDNLTSVLSTYMEGYKKIAIDSLYGANVETFTKTSTDAVQQSNSVRLQNLFQEGVGLVTYFGHSSATTLEYNLDDPYNYNNPGKYPLFILLGCNAGNFFNFNLARLATKETISEKYVLAQNRGGIASMASTSLGIVHYLDIYNSRTYKSFSVSKYGLSLGEIMKETITDVFSAFSQADFFARIHCEQSALHGDPALKMNSAPLPDYAIEDQLVKIAPSFISVAETSFKVDAKFINLGKAVNKDIVIELSRTYPDLSTAVIKRDTIEGIRYIDSLSFTVPIDAVHDKGLNKITIKVDADNKVAELYESNNSITKDIFIFEDEARPVTPSNFAIINQQGIKVIASTANPFSAPRNYTMEMDTTELFNSPFKITRTLNSPGGILEFTPGITFVDNTVYYWRVSPVPISGPPVWNGASFIYLSGSEIGFNQSHYYQHNKSDKERIHLDGQDRKWKYDSLQHFIFSKNAVFQSASQQEGDLIVAPDGNPYIRSACVGFSLIFNIFEPTKFKPNENLTGQYGSAAVCSPSRRWNYEYSFMNPASRKLAMDFMDSIPAGWIVVVRNIVNSTQSSGFIDTWKNDTLIHGSGNSLYHKLKSVGFDQVDSLTNTRAFIYMYKKGDNSFIPASAVSAGIYDVISLTKNLKSPDTLGYITSPLFGRAKAWKQLKWRGTSVPDILPGDLPTVDVIGVDVNGIETTLYSDLSIAQQDYNIAGINPLTYPYLRLKMRNSDSVNFSPYQLQYWRVTYTPMPEGLVAPNIFIQTKDTLDVGEPLDFKVAFKNVSATAFDSLLLKLVVTDKNNVKHFYQLRRRPLPAVGTPNDTLQAGTTIDTKALVGANSIFLDVNPDNDQPEQFHFNNFLYRNFYVRGDSLNPLLDVTFDGVHILNRDIVSSRPDILIKLKDESKWMSLDDTSLVTVEVKYPNGSDHKYYFRNNDTLRFTAAGQAPNSDNTASINFKPYFPVDGEYIMTVTGKDKSSNSAGNIQYRVSFQVINTPMISNMLNYPNPFTSSTAFVFTLTGNEVPQNLKIEIMTVTGKVVREITKDELGPIHIGRNITEFKWDGTDQYGQKLANGIYLYRVVTNLKGKQLDKYRADGDLTDKYFNKGYGKMYLMR